MDRAHWDDDENRWHVFTADGREYVAQFLIWGAGALHIPSMPDIEGRDEFAGAAFHSAEWDHSVDLTGKRVAVIGTGASAIQMFPRSSGRSPNFSSTNALRRGWCRARTPRSRRRCAGPWRTCPACVPWSGWAIYWSQEALAIGMTKRPNLLKFIESYCKYNIRRAVKDKELRRKLIPNYRIGCKRATELLHLLRRGRRP